jgi:hypothetical protein
MIHTRVFLGEMPEPCWEGSAPPLREGDLLSAPSRAAVRVTYVKTHLLEENRVSQEVRVR